MPFEKLTPHALTAASIGMYAPAVPGVYGISNAREWIFIGQSDNIRDALTTYLSSGGFELMGRGPMGFVYEVCPPERQPERCRRLIAEYNPSGNRAGSTSSSRPAKFSRNRMA